MTIDGLIRIVFSTLIRVRGKQLMTEKRDEFVQNLKDKMDEWNEEINRLEIKIEQTEGEAREEYEKQLEKLQEKRAELKRKKEELLQASEDAWHELKDGVENAWSGLEQAILAAKSKFDRN